MWLTFGLALLVVAICMAGFVWLGTPVYRLDDKNVRAILILMIEGEATENDWEVFSGMPIRHNETLDNIRLRCCDIVEQGMVISQGKLRLSDQAKSDVKQLLDTLAE